MSEYQYYEFCSLKAPLTAKARTEMQGLSSRAVVGTHGASYTYNYSDFRGDATRLLVKHFDMFFYISKWGNVRVMLKYPEDKVDIKKLRKHCLKDVVSCQKRGKNIVLDVNVCAEEGGGSWVQGEGLLPLILPLYEEIISEDYRFLYLAIEASCDVDEGDCVQKSTVKMGKLSAAQKEFRRIIEFY